MCDGFRAPSGGPDEIGAIPGWLRERVESAAAPNSEQMSVLAALLAPPPPDELEHGHTGGRDE